MRILLGVEHVGRMTAIASALAIVAWISASTAAFGQGGVVTAAPPQAPGPPPIAAERNSLAERLDAAQRRGAGPLEYIPLLMVLLKKDQDLGDALADRGDLAGALVAYRDLQSRAQHFADEGPQYPSRLDMVTIADDRIADVLMTQGDLPGAKAAYEDDIALTRKLAAGPFRGSSNPAETERTLRRELCVRLQKFGDVRAAQGDLDDARKAYEESLTIARVLVLARPASQDLQRNLAVSMWHLAKMGGSTVRWPDVVAQLEQMDRAHLISPEDQGWLPEAKRQAALPLAP